MFTDFTIYSAPYHYVYVTSTLKNWNGAKADCESKGAVLVKIGSAATNTILTQHLPK